MYFLLADLQKEVTGEEYCLLTSTTRVHLLPHAAFAFVFFFFLYLCVCVLFFLLFCSLPKMLLKCSLSLKKIIDWSGGGVLLIDKLRHSLEHQTNS